MTNLGSLIAALGIIFAPAVYPQADQGGGYRCTTSTIIDTATGRTLIVRTCCVGSTGRCTTYVDR
jgi:hypothetical protein